MDGRVILTPFVLPQETAKVETRDDVHADLVEVVTPAPERVAAPCPLFARCGGCQYQHAPYEFQVARKVEILREQLRRVGKIDYQGEIDTVSGPAFGVSQPGRSFTSPMDGSGIWRRDRTTWFR